MCGIVGYTGARQAQPVLLAGLEHLEYRGYDSAGVAVGGSRLQVVKTRGRLEALKKNLTHSPLQGTWGIGHTRWATHGEPSDLNAHPHTDARGEIALVHNGIIENHVKLRSFLISKGYAFISQTDTEVIVHLLSYLHTGDMLKTLSKAAAYLEGSYALAVLHKSRPGDIFCIRQSSPLIIGRGEGEQFLASDIPALLPHTRQVLLMEDGQIAHLAPHGIALFDAALTPKPLSFTQISWDAQAAEKGGYPHFMLKEIYEEPQALERTFSAHQKTPFPLSPSEARAAACLTVAACGTAYHAGLLGRCYMERLAHLPTRAETASEFRYQHHLTQPNGLFLAISQSGETADTLAALKEAQRLGVRALALCNVLGASIPRRAGKENTMYTWAGPEIAVASTKAYITQAEMLLLWAMDLGVKRETLSPQAADKLRHELSLLPSKAEKLLQRIDTVQRFCDSCRDVKHVFFIGRGADWAVAMEASLKLKEVSYVFSEAYAAGEMKHGAIALIEPGVPVAAVITQAQLADKTLANVREVKARGARTLILCPESLREKCVSQADECWLIPDAPEELLPLLAIIPLQLFAYEMALRRGCDVDKPRNLAKSVTVE